MSQGVFERILPGNTGSQIVQGVKSPGWTPGCSIPPYLEASPGPGCLGVWNPMCEILKVSLWSQVKEAASELCAWACIPEAWSGQEKLSFSRWRGKYGMIWWERGHTGREPLQQSTYLGSGPSCNPCLSLNFPIPYLYSCTHPYMQTYLHAHT